MDALMRSFYSKMENENFEAYGILDSNNKIHTLGTDSKIIGRIFEMFAQPILEEIATENNMILKTPESQTVYPDFIMMRNPRDNQKIAIDIKTTYVDNENSSIKFTLGSYGSYMRNNTKNIENISKEETTYKKNTNSNNMYLEEVSRKLAEAEIPDEIERTNYELKQEEDAIISFKELMEKKDSIQTIDEEDAVISIEELMNRNNQKTEAQLEEERKLYNLTEEEENDNFIKELKQFRNDL